MSIVYSGYERDPITGKYQFVIRREISLIPDWEIVGPSMPIEWRPAPVTAPDIPVPAAAPKSAPANVPGSIKRRAARISAGQKRAAKKSADKNHGGTITLIVNGVKTVKPCDGYGVLIRTNPDGTKVPYLGPKRNPPVLPPWPKPGLQFTAAGLRRKNGIPIDRDCERNIIKC